jgi:hypothetical protein
MMEMELVSEKSESINVLTSLSVRKTLLISVAAKTSRRINGDFTATVVPWVLGYGTDFQLNSVQSHIVNPKVAGISRM